ncbi:MAG: fimbria/pilus periplasmic chaperone [Scandinavium sp.]|uniref:fimbria/pilus periplasmic chaperone n=1 Tax=Scandinavium sp. TaxID=2830653 RepID=UPI003F385C71
MKTLTNTAHRCFNITLAAAALMLSVQAAHAGGIALGATRVIYMQGEKQATLPIINSTDKGTFLIQSWVTKADETKSTDFVLTPPLFVIHPKKENTLRIMYTGPQLATDKESLFYLNVKAIPSVDKSQLQGNTLQIATQSVIKLFVRPKNLPTPAIDAPKALTCSVSGNNLVIKNASPYHVTMVNLYVGGQRVHNTMVPPKGKAQTTIPGGKTGTVTFESVNDFGANTPKQTCTQ